MIEDYHPNEESLKESVENYMVGIEKEGQRYQTLKAHAEEKCKLANEIAQAWSRDQAEALVSQVSPRKEQCASTRWRRLLRKRLREIMN